MLGIVIFSLLLGDFLPNLFHICLNLLFSLPCDVSVVSFTQVCFIFILKETFFLFETFCWFFNMAK